MVAFIHQHGIEEVARIKQSENNEYTSQKNNYVAAEKEKIEENFKNELANEEVRMKIEKSKAQNFARIERMRKVNEFVEQLRSELRQEIRSQMNSDQDAYKELLKNLLIQVSAFVLTPAGTRQAHGRPGLHPLQRGRQGPHRVGGRRRRGPLP